jgi:hypothetical protein
LIILKDASQLKRHKENIIRTPNILPSITCYLINM